MSTLVETFNPFNESLNNCFFNNSVPIVKKEVKNKVSNKNNVEKLSLLWKVNLEETKFKLLKIENIMKIKYHIFKMEKVSAEYNSQFKEDITVHNGREHEPIFSIGWEVDQTNKFKNLVIKAVLGAYYRNLSIRIPYFYFNTLYVMDNMRDTVNNLPEKERLNLENTIKSLCDEKNNLFQNYDTLFFQRRFEYAEMNLIEVVNFWDMLVDSLLMCENLVRQAMITRNFKYSHSECKNLEEINFVKNRYLMHVLVNLCQDVGHMIGMYLHFKYHSDVSNVDLNNCKLENIEENIYQKKNNTNILLNDILLNEYAENHIVTYKFSTKAANDNVDHKYDKNNAQIIDQISVDNHKIIVTINSDGTNNIEIKHNNNVNNKISNLVKNLKHCRFGWKAAMTFDGLPCIIKVYIPKSAKLVRCSDKTVPGKYRTDKMEVIAIYPLIIDHDARVIFTDKTIGAAVSMVNPSSSILYSQNSLIKISDLDVDQNKDCSAGLHFHFSIYEALQWFEEILIYHNKNKKGEKVLGDEPTFLHNSLQSMYNFDRISIILKIKDVFPLELINQVKQYLFEF